MRLRCPSATFENPIQDPPHPPLYDHRNHLASQPMTEPTPLALSSSSAPAPTPDAEAEAGGFIPAPPPTLLSPPPSSPSASSTRTAPASTLPIPRSTPLKAGSAKETALIEYLDRGIKRVWRRSAVRGDAGSDASAAVAMMTIKPATAPATTTKATEEAHGYTSFAQAARDLSHLIDLIWVSGTPSLQIPYLLTIALMAVTQIPAFGASPRAMFALLAKLDAAFVRLLGGAGMVGRGMSGTEKVRLKSLVERTRVVVVRVAEGMVGEGEEDEEGWETEASVSGGEGGLVLDDEGDFDMDVARVYEKTLGELGDELGGPAIGIPDG